MNRCVDIILHIFYAPRGYFALEGKFGMIFLTQRGDRKQVVLGDPFFIRWERVWFFNNYLLTSLCAPRQP